MIDIERISRMTPLNSYAPTWDIAFGTAMWNEDAKIDQIRTYIIEKEHEIVKLDPHTETFEAYNLFDLEKKESVFGDLFKWLQKTYIEYVKKDNTPVEDLKIVAWYNSLTEGSKIDSHHHGASPITYLSGNMHLDNYNTKTFYQYPYEHHLHHIIQNKKGQVTIFPSCIFHHSDEYEGGEKRISIAFDLWQTKHFGVGESGRVPSLLATKTFMNKEIANEIRSS